MSYLSASSKAKTAITHAEQAAAAAKDPGTRELANAVNYLAQAVSELARQLNRDQD